jgi:hypothetical protein
MRTLTFVYIGILVTAPAAPAPAADTPLKAGGEISAPAAKPLPQKKKSPYAWGLRFSVPYSFAKVHKDLKNAVIRCEVIAEGTPMGGAPLGEFGAGLPGTNALPTSIGSGSVVIALNGKATSGTATIIPKPRPGASFDDAIGYLCMIQVNNGFETVSPGTGANLPPWAKSQGGSQIAVSGSLE